MKHYFTYDSTQKSNLHEVKFSILEHEFSLTSDDNVFSSRRLDAGTYILIKVLLASKISGKFLDLGCGYGSIGVVLKSFKNDLTVTSSDVNKRCVELTEINFKKMNLEATVIESDSYTKINDLFDCVSLNSPISCGKEIIYKMYQETKEHLKENGLFYLVIRKDKGALSHMKYLSSLFSSVNVIYKEKGYYVILAK